MTKNGISKESWHDNQEHHRQKNRGIKKCSKRNKCLDRKCIGKYDQADCNPYKHRTKLYTLFFRDEGKVASDKDTKSGNEKGIARIKEYTRKQLGPTYYYAVYYYSDNQQKTNTV